MFHLQTPVAKLDVSARSRVYREFLKANPNLTEIEVGCHNEMVILAEDAATSAQSAVLIATGHPGEKVFFPLHRHGKGEIQVCLEGTYGEALPPGQCIDDIFPWGETLSSFQSQYPGMIEVEEDVSNPGGLLVKLQPGSGWNFVTGSQHAPVGWIGENGVLMAQIYWPGPNQILSATPANEKATK